MAVDPTLAVPEVVNSTFQTGLLAVIVVRLLTRGESLLEEGITALRELSSAIRDQKEKTHGH